MPNDLVEPVVRLVAAMLVGMTLGLDRDLRGKPTGVRTLGLVAVGSALAAIVTLRFLGSLAPAANEAMTPGAVHGLVQGVLTGIGFIGAGVIIRSEKAHRVQGLATAAMVWLTAIMGLGAGSATGVSSSPRSP
jgi:putative Mg2+ transporter-C (MgtC) family protein